jgi:hypothetical protein
LNILHGTQHVILEKQLPHKCNAALRKKALDQEFSKEFYRLRQILLSKWVNCDYEEHMYLEHFYK